MWREFAVAEVGGELVGMFHLQDNCLNAIHLDPKCKRQGIGSRLMDEAERRIASRHREARLEVRAFNKAAIAFYEKRGWMARRTYQGDECGEQIDTIEMTKTLPVRPG